MALDTQPNHFQHKARATLPRSPHNLVMLFTRLCPNEPFDLIKCSLAAGLVSLISSSTSAIDIPFLQGGQPCHHYGVVLPSQVGSVNEDKT